MIDVSTYIKLVLEKKKWTRTKLCEEINKIEARLGEKRTTNQNITNYLNGMWAFRPKILAKWEQALGLPRGSLINMVAPPLGKDAKNELRETIERLDKVK
jgi:transcriptional regulator with XRE-family HTH domain